MTAAATRHALRELVDIILEVDDPTLIARGRRALELLLTEATELPPV